ncbi:hypothetical protein O3G_MSEX015343 [Manduca sexta]|nr:hypothetical protein O3G_MSEX015343 [Manduca sexta]
MRLTSEYIGRSNDDDNTRADARRKMSWRRRLSVTLYESRMGILRRSPPATLRHTASNLTVTSRETDEESESVCAGGTEDEAKEAKRESADRQTTGIKRKTEK